jgi:hypothetical protein
MRAGATNMVKCLKKNCRVAVMFETTPKVSKQIIAVFKQSGIDFDGYYTTYIAAKNAKLDIKTKQAPKKKSSARL